MASICCSWAGWPALAGTNVTLEAPLQFAVEANTTNISVIELFSTGGSVGAVANQQAAVVSVPSASLGLGLHPCWPGFWKSLKSRKCGLYGPRGLQIEN